VDRVEGAKPADVTQSVRKYAAQKPPASRVPSAKTDSASEVPPVIKKVNNLGIRLKNGSSTGLTDSSSSRFFLDALFR